MTDFTDEDVQRGVAWTQAAFPNDAAWMVEDDVRGILAAVLPEYAKRVRAQALRQAADTLDANDGPVSRMLVAAWLRARADAEEGNDD